MTIQHNAMTVVLDSGNADALCAFYAKLLGWTRLPYTPGDEYALLIKDNSLGLVFQQVNAYERPTWPWQAGKQQQMMHLDFYVENVKDAAAYALSLGATYADYQDDENWRTMIDPAGHPFCLLPKRND